MRIEQKEWISGRNWLDISGDPKSNDSELVLAFGGKKALSNADRFTEMRQFYPKAQIISCSTAGEILGAKIADDSISLTAIKFDSTTIVTAKVTITNADQSFDAGLAILKTLDRPGLVYILVISDGQIVNGSELVRSLGSGTNKEVVITGGLAGDGADFKSTLVGLNAPASEGEIVAVGFYGDKLKVGHASKGGWDPFGPERVITKSKNNILYELDGQSALELYKKYLGDLAKELPSSALLFPLSIKMSDDDIPLVRTVLGVDENSGSMTFAGDMPIGARARLMKSNFERLIDGASIAANTSISDFGSFEPDFAILISCAGRKFVLKERVDEELESVREVLGEKTVMAGFYSYGEISPILRSTKCELHNQTMTITTLKELA